MTNLGKFAAACAVVMTIAAPVQAVEPAGVIGSAISDYIVPGYERLTETAGTMKTDMGRLCADPSDAHLDAARDGFDALVEAWARIDMIRFGPAISDYRMEKILFWPDRRSLALKQVQGVLATKDETVLSLETLTEKSVGLQGLGALEFILFGTGSEALAAENDGFRCSFGQTVAANIEAIGGELVTAWRDPDGIAQRLVDPKPDYPDFRTMDEAMSEFLGVFSYGFERMRMQELTPILRDGPQSARPKSALFWRADLSMDMLAWEARGLRDLYETSGLAELLGEDGRWIEGSLDFEFANFLATADGLTAPVADVLADPEGWNQVQYLSILTASLEEIYGAQVAAVLGLDLGFSALDGD